MENIGMNTIHTMGYYMVEGTIVDIEPVSVGRNRANGCMMSVSVEDMDGNIVNFIVTSATFVVNYITLKEGMECSFYHQIGVPVPLIYPPQYNASVVAPKMEGVFVEVGFFNRSLVNERNTLQLKIDGSTTITTANNQIFLGSPAEHNLVVLYENSTRSIPAQTTPNKIVVLCEI